jgi:hypothetical protein
MKRRATQQGNIFIVSLGLLLMMTFLGISLFFRVEKEFRVEESGHEQVNAFNAAETGLQVGMFWLEDVASNENYPDEGLLDTVQVPSMVAGVPMAIASGASCYGYARFNPLNLTASSAISNNPSTDMGPPLSSGLRLLNSAPTGISGCTLLSVPSDSTLSNPTRLAETLFDFYVEALPTETAEAAGQQVGVSNVYGHSGANVSYPYRIRAVGRHHPQAETPFDPTSDTEAEFDNQVVIDLWVHYES